MSSINVWLLELWPVTFKMQIRPINLYCVVCASFFLHFEYQVQRDEGHACGETSLSSDGMTRRSDPGRIPLSLSVSYHQLRRHWQQAAVLTLSCGGRVRCCKHSRFGPPAGDQGHQPQGDSLPFPINSSRLCYWKWVPRREVKKTKPRPLWKLLLLVWFWNICWGWLILHSNHQK